MKNKLHYEITVVLVRSIYDRNVGSSSRAMANMGANRLILINPQCDITYEAQQAAATGQYALQNRIVYQTIDDFMINEKEGLRIAFSARDGRGRSTRDFNETLDWLINNSHFFESTHETTATHLPIYLFFGPEDAGLNSDDIKDVHYCCSIPTYGDNSSLNLSQAVLLGLFILRQKIGGQTTLLDGQQDKRTYEMLPSLKPDESLKQWLEALNVDTSSKRINAFSVLKRMFLQNTPSPKEYQMLETMVQQTVRKLKKLDELERKNR